MQNAINRTHRHEPECIFLLLFQAKRMKDALFLTHILFWILIFVNGLYDTVYKPYESAILQCHAKAKGLYIPPKYCGVGCAVTHGKTAKKST